MIRELLLVHCDVAGASFVWPKLDRLVGSHVINCAATLILLGGTATEGFALENVQFSVPLFAHIQAKRCAQVHEVDAWREDRKRECAPRNVGRDLSRFQKSDHRLARDEITWALRHALHATVESDLG